MRQAEQLDDQTTTIGTANKHAAYIKKKSPSYVHVAERLRAKIIAGELKPGDRLPSENNISEMLNVSRTTAREAFRLLASQHLIETRRGIGGGVFVVHPTHSDIESSMHTALGLMASTGELSLDEIIEGWLMVAPVTARLATERRTDEEAERLIAMCKPLPPSASDDEWVEASLQFSRLLLAMTRNRVLPLLVRPLMHILPEYLRAQRKKSGWWEQNAKEYRKLALAIKRGDAEAASREITKHIQKYLPATERPRRR